MSDTNDLRAAAERLILPRTGDGDEHAWHLFIVRLGAGARTGDAADDGLPGVAGLPDGPLRTLASRRALYVSVMLHDIAKGRGGDHSEVGAEIASTLCPRLGLTAEETETVSWLVRYHLAMSATAFQRVMALDPRHALRFVAAAPMVAFVALGAKLPATGSKTPHIGPKPT